MPWARRACAYASMAVGCIRCSADRDVPQATSARTRWRCFTWNTAVWLRVVLRRREGAGKHLI
jgi:hypothetical protein